MKEEESSKAGSSRVLSCGCSSAYQDEKYGKGKRVFNIGKASQSGQYAKCTVCSNKVRA